MVYAEIFATLTEVQHKAGANASTVSNAAAYVTDFMFQAESYINAVCCYNFSDNYTTLNDDVKGILKLAASNIAAMYVLNYDLSGFSSAREAETMLDILSDGADKAISQLKEKAVIAFMRAA